MAHSTCLIVGLLAVLSGVTTLIGVALALYIGHSLRALAAGIGFSTGIMLLISLIELVPTAFQDLGGWPTVAATGIGALTVAALNALIPHTHLFEEKTGVGARHVKAAYLVALGLVLHDLPEGFAMANSYVASPALGVFVALGIAVHNVPEEFAMAAPAVGLKDRRLLVRAAVFSALAEPVGAAVGLLAVGWQPRLNAFFIAFAAGAMVFISLHELIPLARMYHRPRAFVSGFAASGVLYAALAFAIRA